MLLAIIFVLLVYVSNTSSFQLKWKNPNPHSSLDSSTIQSSLVLPSMSTKLAETYSGKAIEAYYNQRPLVVWQRLVDIGSPILGWYK
jgi:hypothetical protein